MTMLALSAAYNICLARQVGSAPLMPTCFPSGSPHNSPSPREGSRDPARDNLLYNATLGRGSRFGESRSARHRAALFRVLDFKFPRKR
jgi:hypothetical protein